MNTLLLLKNSTSELCFLKSDLKRIDALGSLTVLDANNPEDLQAGWEKHAANIDTVITGWESLSMTAERLQLAPKLKLISHAAGSVRPIVTPAVWDRSIRVISANQSLAIGVAETTLGLIITGLKGIFTTSAHTREAGWKRGDSGISGFPVRELFDVNIGIIGVGAIGRHLITLLKPFEVKIKVFDPYLSPEQAKALGVTSVSLHELMSTCEVVSLHAPALPVNKHMLSTAEFSLMQQHAIFINTARGMLVDEEALVKTLETGRVFAFIDVTNPEPPDVDHPFRKLPNVVLTPHIAGAISNGCLRLGRSIADSLTTYANTQTLPCEVTEEMLQRIA